MAKALPSVGIVLWFAAVAFLCWLPLRPSDRILNTQADDLANHVRLVHEYTLALREGQFPPLVAPALEGGRRVPVFQYYGNTPYLLPGALALAGLGPYTALKTVVFLHLLAAGSFTYLACRALGLCAAAALVAGTAYQTFPFAGCDLISRGAYTEFVALETVPLVFYCGLRLLRTSGPGDTLRWLCLTALSLAYFIPLHPVQTVLCGALILALLVVHSLSDSHTRGTEPARLLAALVCGAAATAWYWIPLARDRADLRVSPHAGFFDAGLASFKALLWPWHLRPEPWPWAPQLGFHFALAAAAILLVAPWRRLWSRCCLGSPGRRPARAIAVTAALALATILVLIRFGDSIPAWLYHVLKPLQWTYRLLIPAALAGAVCLALVFDVAISTAPGRWARGALVVVTLAYVVGISMAYFHGQAMGYLTTTARVVSPDFESPNTSGYALRGTDYTRLPFVRPDGSLNTGARIVIPSEGHPTEVELVLRPEGDATGDVDVNLGDAREPMDARNPDLPRLAALRPAHRPLTWSNLNDRRMEKTPLPGGALRLAFSFVPPVGLVPGDTAVRFESRPPGLNWSVQDLTFRTVGEPPDRACRVPTQLQRVVDGRHRTQFWMEVPPGRAGLYQLPVYSLPSNEVVVTGRHLARPPAGNRAMTVVPLREGSNVIRIRTRHTRAAWWVSAIALGALVAGAMTPGPAGRLIRRFSFKRS